ncbi:MAG: response regulator transcription factor [Myxococcota bacterium]|nr:response regulator transcription factor [Myxococcota bacterium]
MHLLVVEDSLHLGQFLEKGLQAKGHAVTLVTTLEGAREALEHTTPDTILLDRRLPDGDGLNLVDEIRQAENNIPILMLSALADVDSRVEGLRTGADDYLAKPFSFEELLLRLEKLLSRPPASAGLLVGPIRIDPDGHRVWVNEQPITLTAKEFALLLILANSAGRVFSGTQLLAQVWGIHNNPDSNLLAVHISNIRNKIGPDLLHTIRGVGYVLDPTRTESHERQEPTD